MPLPSSSKRPRIEEPSSDLAAVEKRCLDALEEFREWKLEVASEEFDAAVARVDAVYGNITARLALTDKKFADAIADLKTWEISEIREQIHTQADQIKTLKDETEKLLELATTQQRFINDLVASVGALNDRTKAAR